MRRMSLTPALIGLALLVGSAACQPAPTLDQLPTRAVLPTAPPTIDTTIRALSFWEAARAELTRADEVQRWAFSARAGDPIRLRALGPVTLTLLGPDDSALGTGTDIAATLPTDGVYSVQVRAAEGAVGTYELGLGYTDRPNPSEVTATPPPATVFIPTPTPAVAGDMRGPLVAGVPLSGRFEEGATVRHVYRIDGRAGLFITVRMNPTSGPVDPLLTLYGPSGAAIALDGDGGGDRAALLRNILLLEDGVYLVQAAGGGLPGVYSIELEESLRPLPVTPTIIARPSVTPFAPDLTPTLSTAVPGGSLVDHIPVLGGLNAPDGVNLYPINAGAGSLISVGAMPLEGSTLRPRLELFGLEGELVARAEAAAPGREALITAWPVPAAGTYTLFVTALDGTTGAYRIAYGDGTREEVLRGEAAVDTPYDGLLAGSAVREVWYLSLSAGDVITAAISPLGGALDPLVELIAPDGSRLIAADNRGGFPNALLQAVTIPVTGPYRLRVRAADFTSAGPYRLIWRYINVAPTPTADPPRISLMTVRDAVTEGEYRFYPFQARGGQRVRVQVTGGDGLDPVAALLGPDGAVMIEVDDVNGDLNPSFVVPIPADGTYTVRVNGYLSSGPFALAVDALFSGP